MTPPLRTAGEPSPLAAGTHDAAALPPPIPYLPEMAPPPTLALLGDPLPLDPLDLGEAKNGWVVTASGLIRPICVGALMAIPTVGAAFAGLVALVSAAAAERMTHASISFLAGIPDGGWWLIGSLAGGYTVARTVEKVTGAAGGQR